MMMIMMTTAVLRHRQTKTLDSTYGAIMSKRLRHDEIIKQWRRDNPIEVGSYVECTRFSGESWCGFVTRIRTTKTGGKQFCVARKWSGSATIVPQIEEVEAEMERIKADRLEEKRNEAQQSARTQGGIREIKSTKYQGRNKPQRAKY